MWLSTFCSMLVLAGFGCAPTAAAPEAPITLTASVHGSGSAGILVVHVLTKEGGSHAKVDITLPDGVQAVGVAITAEAEVIPGTPKTFRFPLKADKPGLYILAVRVMAGDEDYRFGKTVSVAWIAEQP